MKLRFQLVALLGMMIAAAAQGARPFPIAAGSYTADVVFRLDKHGARLASAQGFLSNCATQFGSPSDVIDYALNPWALMNMADANSTATVRITLDRIYTLNKIVTQYPDSIGFPSGDYELRVSLDGVSWTTNVARKAIGGYANNDTFSATDVRYIEWQVWGPGNDLSGTRYTYLAELSAYVASSASVVPMKDDGYNMVHTGTLLSKSGWISWAQPEAILDNNLATYAIPSPPGVAVLDLGGVYQVYQIRWPFYPGQTWGNGGLVEISRDQVTWMTVAQQTPFGAGNATFDSQYIRYIRVSGDGNGALTEIEAFALPPAPGTVILVK